MDKCKYVEWKSMGVKETIFIPVNWSVRSTSLLERSFDQEPPTPWIDPFITSHAWPMGGGRGLCLPLIVKHLLQGVGANSRGCTHWCRFQNPPFTAQTYEGIPSYRRSGELLNMSCGSKPSLSRHILRAPNRILQSSLLW